MPLFSSRSRSGIAGSKGNSVFSFWGTAKLSSTGSLLLMRTLGKTSWRQKRTYDSVTAESLCILKSGQKTLSRMSSRDQHWAIKNITVYPWNREFLMSLQSISHWDYWDDLFPGCSPSAVVHFQSFPWNGVLSELSVKIQTSFVTRLVKILKWFTMAFRIHCRFPSWAHQDLDPPAPTGVFSFSFSLPPTWPYAWPHPLLVGPRVGKLSHPFWPPHVLSFARGANGPFSSSSNTLSCQSPHDSSVWTFDTLHCILIASFGVLLGSARTGTVTLFSLSCVSNTCSSAWHEWALKIDVWTKLGKAGC